MQTREERVEALRTLLPLVEVHLAFMDGSPGAAEYGYSDGEEGAPEKAEPCIGDHCLHCTDRCPGFSWEQLWRGLRKDYPVIPDLEVLLDQLMYVDPRWRCGVYYTLVQPWDEYDRAHRQEWCQRGLEWLADELAANTLGLISRTWRHIEPYVPRVEWGRKKRRGPDPRQLRDARIIALRTEGASYHRIASEVGCSKSTVRAVLAGHEVRRGRTLAR